MDPSKPRAEILVEGEWSPFEHEALYRLLKKHFRLEQPSYSDLLDGSIGDPCQHCLSYSLRALWWKLHVFYVETRLD